MKPRFFVAPATWRRWLADNHAKKTELLVGFFRVGSGKNSITWPEAVDEALCFGWIDGVRQRIDGQSYTIRFTPRRANSMWSLRNLERVAVLTDEGRMHASGLAICPSKQDAARLAQEREAPLDPRFERTLRANAPAWAYFKTRPPSYRKQATFWVMSGKQQATRERRLEQLIASSAASRPIPPLTAGRRK